MPLPPGTSQLSQTNPSAIVIFLAGSQPAEGRGVGKVCSAASREKDPRALCPLGHLPQGPCGAFGRDYPWFSVEKPGWEVPSAAGRMGAKRERKPQNLKGREAAGTGRAGVVGARGFAGFINPRARRFCNSRRQPAKSPGWGLCLLLPLGARARRVWGQRRRIWGSVRVMGRAQLQGIEALGLS